MNIRTNILAIIFCSLSASVATKVLAQQSSINQQLDSIVALLPQLGDSFLEEAHRQKKFFI